MKNEGRKLDLSTVLGTNDKKQQAIAAARLKNLAFTPIINVTILYDPRFHNAQVGVLGAEVDPQGVIKILEAARTVVLNQALKEQKNGAQGLPTPNLPGNPSPAGPGTDN